MCWPCICLQHVIHVRLFSDFVRLTTESSSRAVVDSCEAKYVPCPYMPRWPIGREPLESDGIGRQRWCSRWAAPAAGESSSGLATGNDSISEASCLKRLRHGAAWKLLVNCVSMFMSLLYPHTIRSNILILLHASCFISLLCSVTLPGSSASPHRIEGARALISRCDSIPTSGPRQFNHGRARRRRTRRCRACPGTHRCTSTRCSTTAIGGPTSARWSEPNTSSEGCSSWLFDVMAAARLSRAGASRAIAASRAWARAATSRGGTSPRRCNRTAATSCRVSSRRH